MSKINLLSYHNQQQLTQEQEQENGNVGGTINYYDAVRIAYQNSTDLREYLNHYTLGEIDKDLKILWKFIYRMLYLERRVKVVNKDANYLIVSWITVK